MGVVVVARWNEGTAWVSGLPDGWGSVIVQKGREVPNVGREATSWLWFMATQPIDPDTTYAFLQGDPNPHGVTADLLRDVDGYTPIGGYVLDCDDDGSPHHGGLPLRARAREWLGVEIPARISFVAGAMFLVPGRVILERPASWYADLQERVARDEVGAWVMERLWQFIWSRTATTSPRPRDPGDARQLRAELVAGIHGGVDPYLGLETRAPDPQGWNSDAPIFARIIDQARPRLVVEVGSWKGASAITMGRLVRGYGVVLCVDTWLGSREFFDDPIRRPWLEARHGYPTVYYTFLSNIVHADLTDTVVPFPTTSTIAARWLLDRGTRPDVVYVDASHDEEDVAADLRNYWAIVAPGGWLFGDDYTDDWPGVGRAVRAHAREHRLDVVRDGPSWCIRKLATNIGLDPG